MAEEATDVQDQEKTEITLEDFNADEQESPKAESSTADDKKPEAEVKETQDEMKPEEPETKETEDESEEKAEEVVEETKPQTKADERKTQLNTEIRDLVAQRNALKTEVAKANEVYQPATEDELVETGMNATDAKVEALRQEMAVRDYNEQVAEAQLTLESESNWILQNYDWSNPESPNFKEELSNEAAQLLAANLIHDENTGQVIGSNISPRQLYKTLDTASGISRTQGQLKGQQDTEKMLANADNASSAAPQKAKTDPLMELWKSDD